MRPFFYLIDNLITLDYKDILDTLYVMAKQVFSTLIEPETLEKLRNLAWWSRKPITKITEQAILEYIKRYEDENGIIPPREEE